MSIFLRTAGYLLIVLLLPAAAGGQLRESFESAETAWRLAGSDSNARIAAQHRVFDQAHSGQGCEYIQLRASQGTQAYLVYAITPSPVIAELTPSVFVKSDRPGIQIMVRVVLPRSLDTHEGQPIRTLLRGDLYSQSNAWQQLRVPDPLALLDRQVPILRSQYPDVVIDHREAYVDLVVLNAYGGSGTTNLWIDDLEVPAHASVASSETQPTAARAAGQPLRQPSLSPAAEHVRMQGDVLLARGRPLMLRMIDWNGESFEALKALGFNTVRLKTVPAPEQLAQARQLDLYLVSPPPFSSGTGRIGHEYDPVLAWDLGGPLREADVARTRELVHHIRARDERQGRPLVCLPQAQWSAFSQLVDVLLLDPGPLELSTSEIAGLSDWIQQRRAQARLGTPVWVTVPTEPAQILVEQLETASSAPAPGGVGGSGLEPDQMRLVAFRSVAAGARGLYFQSRHPLDSTDRTTHLRAKTLQLINSELSAIEAWVAAGKYAEQLPTGNPALRVDVLETERARLLVATQQQLPGQQIVLSAQEESPVSFVVYGSPITDQALLIDGGQLEQLSQQRGTGINIHVSNPDVIANIVLTQDPLVRNHLMRHLRATQQAETQLRYEIAAHWLEATKEVQQQLPAQILTTGARTALQEAEGNLRQCARLLATSDFRGSQGFARRTMANLAQARRTIWKAAVGNLASPVSIPWCGQYAGLTVHYALLDRLRSASWSANGLPAGDMESLEHMFASGWQQHELAGPGLQTSVDLSLDKLRSGRSSLRMRCASTGESSAALDAWPLSVSSAAVPIQPGHLVRIEGWAYVSPGADGQSGELFVADSIGGEELGLHLTSTGGWQPWALYRAAPTGGDLRVRFALLGAGEAFIDDVRVTTVPLGSGLQTTGHRPQGTEENAKGARDAKEAFR